MLENWKEIGTLMTQIVLIKADKICANLFNLRHQRAIFLSIFKTSNAF